MKILKTSLNLFLLLTVLVGIAYPVCMFVVGQVFFRKEANGSLVYDKEKNIIGSELIAQNFTSAKYFQPRPSAANFDASNSSASNLGPTSQALIDGLRSRAAAYRSTNGLTATSVIPADAVTASASGLDPHISVENALFQAPRVAGARSLSLEALKKIIAKHTEHSFCGLFGEKRVNVLRINLVLDGEKK